MKLPEKKQRWVYHAEALPQAAGEGVTRRVLAYTDGLMCVENTFEKGAVGALHHHPHTQITYVVSGAFDFTVDGVTRKLPQPFTVMATENPVGSIGTQMLPESQLDRFMVCVVMGYPDTEAEMEILTRQPRHGLLDRVQPVMDQNDLLTMQAEVDNIYMSDEILRYIVELSQATRKDARLALGLSPRASLAVAGMARAAAYLSGREFVVPQDVTAIFADTAHHRLSLTEQARTGGETVENVIADVLHTVPRPRPEKPTDGR